MIVASVGVHLLLWPLGNRVIELGWPPPLPPPTDEFMEVSLLDPEETPPPADGVKLPGQLVRPDFVPDERPPEGATNRISEFDSRVDQETKAPNRKAAPQFDPRTLGEEAGMPSRASEGSTKADAPAHALPLGRPTEGTADGDADDRRDSELPRGDEGEGLQEPGARAPRLDPRRTAQAMRKTFGGSGSIDALDGVEEGTQNILNSERFRFASFFNRLRSQVEQHWDPNAAMNRIDPTGRTYGARTRTTMLRVRLTPKGAVEKIIVLDGSGVSELDEEAIRAIHQAAPFVNPPAEMVDAATGAIEIDCLFSLQAGKGSIRRYLR